MNRSFAARAGRPRSRRRKIFDYLLAAAILAMLGIVVLRLGEVGTRRLTSVAVTVNDGDSLTIQTVRIRLSGIDAPEYDQTCRRNGADYACGRESRSALARLIAGQPVECSGSETDRYGRLLAVCTAGGSELNRRQVEDGWAVAYGGYRDAEDAARTAKRGLWAGEFDRPRDWRDHHGGLAESEHDALGAAIGWIMQIAGWR